MERLLPHEKEDLATLSDLSLLLSLAFGGGQVLIGAFVARGIIATQRWRSPGAYLLLLVCLWFVCSGVAELIVSGLEAARRLTGAPNTATVARWRGAVDGALIGATLVLGVAMLAYPLLRRVDRLRRRGADEATMGPSARGQSSE